MPLLQFERDVAQAKALCEGRAKAYVGPGSGRIDDDVQLGYWMSQMPNLHVVCMRPCVLRAHLRRLGRRPLIRRLTTPVPHVMQQVTFRRFMAWHDRWKMGVTDMLPRLLLAHKVPWGRFADLLNRTEALWRASPHAATKVYCEGPPCADCAHDLSQHACIVDIELTGMDAHVRNASTAGLCWPKCKFTKAKPPEVPAQCWNDSKAIDWKG